MAAKTSQTREMYLTLSRYTWLKQAIPEDAPEGTEIYYEETIPIALCFTGKAGKASLYCRYSNNTHRAHEVEKWYQRIFAAAAQKASFDKARADAVCPFTVGQILYGTYGYEQTNAVFYKVRSVRGKKLELVRLQNTITESDMVGVAVPGSERSEVTTRMARFTQSGWRVKGGESVELQEWHGRPVHITSYH